MTDFDDLVSWLWRQIASEERLAMRADADGTSVYFDTDDLAAVEHYQAWEPERVVAECAAKWNQIEAIRQLPHDGLCRRTHPKVHLTIASVGNRGPMRVENERYDDVCDCGLDDRRWRLIAAMAAPYAGRDGWKPEWAVR